MFFRFLLIPLFAFTISTTNAFADAIDDFNSAKLAYKAKDFDKAMKLYQSAIDSGELKGKNLAGAYFNLGNVHMKKEWFNSAVYDFMMAIDSDPNNIDAYYNRGVTYKKQKKYNLAIADYSKVIELKPDDAYAYYSRANAYRELKDEEKAIIDYSKAIELKPKFVQAYQNRGNAYKAKGETNLANADFAKAIELDPSLSAVLQTKLTAQTESFIDEGKAEEYKKAGIVYAALTPFSTKFTAEEQAREEKGYNTFVKELEATGKFKFVSREMTIKAMKSLNMEAGTLYIPKNLLSLGKKLGVNFVFAGSIMKDDGFLSRGKVLIYSIEGYELSSSKEIFKESAKASMMEGGTDYLEAEFQITGGAKSMAEKVVEAVIPK